MIDFQYNEGFTQLQLVVSGIIDASIEVIRDSIFWSPFEKGEIIKDLAVESLDSSDQKVVSACEAYFKTTLNRMSGLQLGGVIMSMMALDSCTTKKYHQ